MIQNSRFLILLTLFPIALACCSSDNKAPQSARETKPAVQSASPVLPFKPKETIRYAIKSLGVNAGEATLSFEGLTKYKGKEAYLIIFQAQAVKFYDQEKIYADPKTFYPIAVERDITTLMGSKEKITEEYFPKQGLISIIKLTGGKTIDQSIQKGGLIDNIYCFIYRYRRGGQFNIGESFSIQLPTKDVTINFVKLTSVKAAGKTFDAYFIQSDPAKYKVWFDTGSKKIPLRINGAVGINDTAMIMTEYTEGKE